MRFLTDWKRPLLILSLFFTVFANEADKLNRDIEGILKQIETKRLTYEVNLNNFIDQNHDGIEQALLLLDPSEIIDRHYSAIAVFNLWLEEGWIQNLSLFKRTGNCLLKYSKKILTVELNIGWDTLAVDYKYTFQRPLLPSQRGDLHGMLFDSTINLVLEANLENYVLKMTKFKFTKVRDFDVKVEGSWTDQITNILIKLFPKRKFIPEIEEVATTMLTKRIDLINEDLKDFATTPKPKFVEMFLQRLKLEDDDS